jgi:xanthine dehydrogenase FAD-binding subunit
MDLSRDIKVSKQMTEFEYAAPTSVAEAARLLSQAKGRAKILAGGTDLLVQLREGLRHADLVVDVKRIPSMTEIRQESSGSWRIGAATPCQQIENHPGIRSSYPALADAVRIIGGWQIKNRATLGGNLCTSSPAGDSLPALIASHAEGIIAGEDGSTSRVPMESFCTGPGENVLQDGELLEAFVLPAPPAGSSGAYLRFIPRHEMDIAVVGCGAMLAVTNGKITAARIGLGAVAPTPLFAEQASQGLLGQVPSRDIFAQAGEQSRAVARPISDMRSPADYRTHLVGVLVKRSLEIAFRRIQGESIDPLHHSWTAESSSL